MHIVLIKPDLPDDIPVYRHAPEVHLGIASIAAVLEQNGIKVSVIDNFLNRESVTGLIQKIKMLNPDIVGINCDLVSICNVSEIVNKTRELGIITIVGGPEVSVHPEETFLRTKADICVYGEGEFTMLELCQLLDRFGLDKDKLVTVKGIVYCQDSSIKVNQSRPLIQDLDVLPFMALHLFPMDKYARSSELDIAPVDLICTSRGCPFHCAFCSNEFVWGKKVRTMSPKRVADEIEQLIKNYNTNVIYFREDNFTIGKKRVIDICNEIKKRQLNIKWICESRVDSLDDALLKTMKDGGCESIWFGVESGSQRILDILEKGITLEQSKDAFRLCSKYKIKTGASVMLGIPGETKEEMKETLKFLTVLKPDYVFFNAFLGIPGSKLYDIIEKKGLIYKRYEGLILPSTEEMSWPEKEKFVEKANIYFQLNIKRIIKKIKKEGLLFVIRKGFKKALKLCIHIFA